MVTFLKKSICPNFSLSLKSSIYQLYLKTKSYISERRRWENYIYNNVEPRVFYGHNRIPISKERVSGGILKAQDLHRLYPNTNRGPNIIYLVSSALPHFPQFMVRFARKKGVKLVWNQNGVAYPAWHGPGYEKPNRLFADFLHQADYVIYQSRFCKISADRYLGERKGPFEILHNPVDTEVFIPLARKPDGLKILLAGTHNEFYRVRIAIETLKEVLHIIPDAELIVAGPLKWKRNEMESQAELEGLCAEMGILSKVRLLGPYAQRDAVSLFQSAHILFHTQYNDACPRMVVEAMSCGLPVVYSESGGTPELVGMEGGIGVEAPLDWEQIHPPDPQELARAVVDVISNYERFSKAARERAVEKFDVRPWLERHKTVFESLVLNKERKVDEVG